MAAIWWRRKWYKICYNLLEIGRRQRKEDYLQLRKQKRHEYIFKKRREGCYNDTCQEIKTLVEDIPMVAHKLWSDDPDELVEGTTQIRKILSRFYVDPPFDEVILAGVVPKFVEFLTRDDLPELQWQAASILAYMVWAKSEQTRVVIEFGAIPMLLRILISCASSYHIKNEAAWVLGNISMDSLAARDLILDHGGLIPLASLLSSPQISDVFIIVPWTLANLCRKPSPPFQKIKPLLPVLIDLIVMPDEKIVRDACCALSCLSEGSDEMIEAIIKAGFIPRLVALLMHQSSEYAEPALRTIGNIVCGSTAQAQAVIDNRVLHCFYLLLTAVCHDTTMISEICWIISNITTDTTTQLEAVIDADLIRPLLRLTRAEFPIKKEAAWAISNACMLGTTEQIQMLVNSDCIIALCDLLSCSDLEVVVFCLEALENILSVAELEEYYLVIDGPNLHAQLMHQCGGWDKILNLLTNGNLQIFERSTQMLLRFWSEDFDVFCQNSRHYRSFSFGTKVPFAFIISPN